ncbi:MAG: two-component sensor histidine kinase [Proteobacteria bacterium]|nr:two-component sensor histidine kinase [Pseudomonadota bacterium]MBU1714804.1 two-component sensor histidine kinase [Pseudomonadota bacterium]
MKRFLPRWSDVMFFCGKSGHNLCVRERYYCLRRSLVVIMLLITIVPVCITATLSYFQYRQLLQEETFSNSSWSAATAGQAIEAFLEKLQAAILVISDVYSFDQLSHQETLDQVFTKLKRRHKGLVDLSVISPAGIQTAYTGPYNLSGKDYTDSPWYNKTLAKNIYVSDVFMGFRNVPHFVVAVSKKVEKGQGSWVLRASIDADTLDRFLASIDSEISDDIFLVNSDWQLQSSSRYHGEIGNQVLPRDTPRKKGITLSEQYRKETPILRAVGYISGTPWILVLEQQSYALRKNWQAFKNKLLIIFTVCILVAGVIVIRTATLLARKIRETDEAREAFLGQSEHTSKLASIGRLAAGVAHEINNPLAIINEKAGLMKDILGFSPDFQYREKFNDQLDSLLKAVQRSRTITHRLLGFARRMDVTLGPVQINEVITEVLGFLDKEALYREIKIELALQDDLPALHSDPGQLQQIFLNIINNAIDAVDDGGLIQIASQLLTDEMVEVSIKDNGPGMTPEIRKKIFEPFFTTKIGDDNKGTGLGLAITYGLIKKLGGQVAVDSVVGQGTTFLINFPIQAINRENVSDEQDENTDY